MTVRGTLALAILCAGGTALLGDGQPAPSAVPPERQARIAQALAGRHKQYDPAARMLGRPFSSPGYHTTLTGGTVHPTRDSLEYAVACLDTGDEALRARAEAVLRRVIGLQDQDPASPTCGVWPWFLEEPLAKMAPPDFNWADFCGVQLLQAALDHRRRLPAELMAEVDAAILRAARAIRKRDVGPGYTNIAIMGAYVTLVAGEHLKDEGLRDYGRARLKRFAEHTAKLGGFSEYNSPTYTVVALTELSRIRQHVRDEESQRLVGPLIRRAWEEIAGHFHPPTRQWAGPHSRAYRTLLGQGTLELIEGATGGRVKLTAKGPPPRTDEGRPVLECPADLHPFFTRIEQPRTLVQTYEAGARPVRGTTYLAPRFALGTVNRGNFWNQQRAVVGYWGTADRPVGLHVRLLKDGYDFAAGQVAAAQQGGKVVAAVGMATDGGDRHVSLDRLKDGKFTARDLRLRCELSGAVTGAEVKVSDDGRSFRVRAGGEVLAGALGEAAWPGCAGRWTVTRDNGRLGVDLVLYEGPARAFDLRALEQAAVTFALEVGADEGKGPMLTTRREEGRLVAAWGGLEAAMRPRPGSRKELVEALRTVAGTAAQP